MQELLPGTEVEARGLRWEVVFAERLGPQTLYRLRGLEGAVQGQELDLLHPFESLHRLVHDFQPEKAAPLRNWLVYHQAFLLEQALGTDALLAVQPGRLRLEPYQLVPVLRAIRMSRPRLLLADGVGLGKTVQMTDGHGKYRAYGIEICQIRGFLTISTMAYSCLPPASAALPLLVAADARC